MSIALARRMLLHSRAGRVPRAGFLLATALLAACTVLTASGFATEPVSAFEHANLDASISIGRTPWALANFDGDRIVDRATSSALGKRGDQFLYRVQLDFSGKHTSSSFVIATKDQWGINVVPRDVDGDHDLDLVISSGLAHDKVSVWINDGLGGFTQAAAGLYSPSIWLEEAGILPAPIVSFRQVLEALDQRSPTAEPGPPSVCFLPPDAGFPLGARCFRFLALSLPARPSRAPPVHFKFPV